MTDSSAARQRAEQMLATCQDPDTQIGQDGACELARDVVALSDRVEAAERERDEALAALKDEMAWDMGGVPENEWKARAVAAEERVAELKRYATHKHDCAKASARLFQLVDCTCGLAALLSPSSPNTEGQ